MSAPRKMPLYTLDHGIEVLSERQVGGRIYCRINAHEFFDLAVDSAGRMETQRARVVMTAHLGRKLLTSEHVHHLDKNDKTNDSLDNLELLTAAVHNSQHKTGTRHSAVSREKIGAGVARAYLEGRRRRTSIVERRHDGRIVRSA